MLTEKYIVVGTGNLAVKIAQYLCDRMLNVVVYEKKLSQHSTVETLCKDKGISYRQLMDEEMTRQLQVDLDLHKVRLISSINTYIFPKEIVEHPNFLGINYHNALLSKHKGMNAEAWAIYNMDKYTGVTWHKLVARVDGGEIIWQKRLELDDKVTSVRLLRNQLEIAYEGFLEIVEQLMSGDLVYTRQEQGNGEFHRIAQIPNEGYIDLSWSMEKISAFLRSMDYGILYTLGKIKIKLDNRSYACRKYRILDKDMPCAKDEVIVSENSISILKKNSTREILLQGIELEE